MAIRKSVFAAVVLTVSMFTVAVADEIKQVDLLVTYTSADAAQIGDHEAVRTYFQSQLDLVNEEVARLNLPISFRMVCLDANDFDETGSHVDASFYMRTDPRISALREICGADLASFMGSSAGLGGLGSAGVGGNNPDIFSSVVPDLGPINGDNLSIIWLHELLHLFGGSHVWAVCGADSSKMCHNPIGDNLTPENFEAIQVGVENVHLYNSTPVVVFDVFGELFTLDLNWEDFQGQTGKAVLMEDGLKGNGSKEVTALIRFTGATNLEVTVKMIWACVEPFNAVWFFLSGMTNQGVNGRLTEISTSESRIIENQVGVLFQPIAETQLSNVAGVGAFPCFP